VQRRCESGNRNIDLNVTTWHGGSDGVDNTLHVGTQLRPLLITEHDDGNLPVGKILLIAVVSRISKPAASAAVKRSPFFSVSQPC
jgi:hypothetical protein